LVIGLTFKAGGIVTVAGVPPFAACNAAAHPRLDAACIPGHLEMRAAVSITTPLPAELMDRILQQHAQACYSQHGVQ
jgi:hypothetical protein